MVWTKDKIIFKLQNLPNNIPINKKQLLKYYKDGMLPFWPGIVANRFGSIKNACKIAGIKCNVLIGKEKYKHNSKLATIWNKEKIRKAVLSVQDQFNTVSEYEKLSKGNKKIPFRGTITKYFKTHSIHEAFKEIGVKYKSHYWSNKRIIKTLQQLYYDNGSFPKTKINKLREKKICCGAKLIRDRFGSLDKFALYANINFSSPKITGCIGQNENKILDNIEKDHNINLLRQYYIAGRFIDGYDPINNIAYEVDELKHKYRISQDFKREEQIKKVLGCKFIRIKDNWN